MRGIFMATITSALIFDTHAFVKRLTQVGMPLEQIKVLADEQAHLIDNRLATKEDLNLLKLDLTIRLGSIVATAAGIIIAAVKLL
jgi:hypothetical protein